MRISLELAAEFRDGQGKGASSRLRHAGRVPAILYGGHVEPRAITLDHQKLMTLIDNEKFYSSIINLVVGDKKQAAIVKDLQMHPARNAIVHVDMQRVSENEKIRIHIPMPSGLSRLTYTARLPRQRRAQSRPPGRAMMRDPCRFRPSERFEHGACGQPPRGTSGPASRSPGTVRRPARSTDTRK